MARIEISGITTTAQTFSEAVATLHSWIHETMPRYVCTCPVYTLMMGIEHAEVGKALNNAAMVTADGMPIVWAQRRLGIDTAERVYGPDIMLTLCESGVDAGVRHFFLGGAPGVAEQVSTHLKARYPGLAVAGTYTPPFAPVGDLPDPEVIAMLNSSNAQVIWVGLGSPKQDVWMMRYHSALKAPLLIGVGAAFDFVAGTKRQAPVWMRRRGLEWFFRLIQEPRRLRARYIVYNYRFLWRVWRTLG